MHIQTDFNNLDYGIHNTENDSQDGKTNGEKWPYSTCPCSFLFQDTFFKVEGHFNPSFNPHYLGVNYYFNFLGYRLGSNGYQLKWKIGTHSNWKKIKISGCRFGATCLPIRPIFEVNWLDWLCCIAGSSKTAPIILIFFQLPLVPIIHLM